MIQACYVKYGTLSGLLLLCTIVLSTTEDIQRLVFAQITPAPEKAGSSYDSSSSSNSAPDTDGGDNGSSGGSDGSSDSSPGTSDDDNDSGDSSSSEE
jgi:hypothetical protein